MRGVEPLRSLGLLLSQRPREISARVAGYADLGLQRLFGDSPIYETVSWQGALRDLEAHLGGVAEILGEPALEETEESTRRLLADIRHEDTFVPHWAADSILARCCYLACRLIEPEAVVETGVAYGVTSAFILRALEENRSGTLHSVDLPPLRKDYQRYWGIAVPEDLRDRWNLYRGTSAGVLPQLFEKIQSVDLFVHDSLHTRRNMRREFDTVWPHLRNGAIIMADDVERNGAFGELRQRDPALWRVVMDRETAPLQGRAAPVVFGVAVK